MEDEARRNWVICEDGGLGRRKLFLGVRSASTRVLDDSARVGDGGCTLMMAVVDAVGVGGYECRLVELEVISSSCSVNWELELGRSTVEGDEEGEMFVRELKERAASVWRGDEAGTGVNGMNTPGGNVGERMRMYHPRRGRCIDHWTVLVGLCC